MRMQCGMTPFCARSCATASTSSPVVVTIRRDSACESFVGCSMRNSDTRRTVPSIRSMTSSSRTARRWMSSRSIGVMNVRSMPRRISCEISSHSCSRRLIWSATVATGASPWKKPLQDLRAPRGCGRAISLKRSKYFSSRGRKLSIAPPGTGRYPTPRLHTGLYARPDANFRRRTAAGKRTWKTLPAPTSPWTSTVAPWSWAMCLTIARPRPVPGRAFERERSTW